MDGCIEVKDCPFHRSEGGDKEPRSQLLNEPSRAHFILPVG